MLFWVLIPICLVIYCIRKHKRGNENKLQQLQSQSSNVVIHMKHFKPQKSNIIFKSHNNLSQQNNIDGNGGGPGGVGLSLKLSQADSFSHTSATIENSKNSKNNINNNNVNYSFVSKPQLNLNNKINNGNNINNINNNNNSIFDRIENVEKDAINTLNNNNNGENSETDSNSTNLDHLDNHTLTGNTSIINESITIKSPKVEHQSSQISQMSPIQQIPVFKTLIGGLDTPDNEISDSLHAMDTNQNRK